MRSYPDYLVSFYTEYLRNNRFIRFERFYKQIDFNTVTWLDLLEDIRVTGFETLRISDFSTFFDAEQQYFDALLGTKGISLSPADNTPAVRRTKLTQQGYDALQLFAQKYALGSAQQPMSVIDSTEQETPATPFMPIPEAQRVEMETRYKTEMGQINRGPGNNPVYCSHELRAVPSGT